MKGLVTARIEVPKGSFIKRELHDGGSIDFVSPLPSPFNYGFIPGDIGADGDPPDALVMGPRLALGAEVELPVVARVRFVDAGVADPKLVLSRAPLTPGQRRSIRVFFTLYARAKALLNLLRGARGTTRFEALELTGAD